MKHAIISHVGIAVTDLEKSIPLYEKLTGMKVKEIEEVPSQKVRVGIFSTGGEKAGFAGGNIELLSGTSEDSPISKFIAKRGEGLHHLCIYVDDIEKQLALLKAAGIRLIDETPRLGAEGHRIAFVHPAGTNGVLIELEEKPK
ncbi:MAG: methylmalonyl-CoA epimerase [candidate division Zixibacteria bacterium]|nr:methylmalonyl-CoA epimerase [candidate division Zixibacteria bacterium]MDD5425972.1 methylmalonyl-CoA epimerase [candidate division Zixibacteria bacterium]